MEDSKPIYIASIIVTDNLFITDIQLQILEAYYNLAEAFSPNKAWKLPLHYEDDLVINIKPKA